MILAEKNPPLVHSVSYGWQGNMTKLSGCKMENVDDVDMDFAKLAARGITIVFASGDTGAGYTPPVPQCPPGSGLQEKVSFIGTVAESYNSDSRVDCCEKSSYAAHKGWTFEMTDPETC